MNCRMLTKNNLEDQIINEALEILRARFDRVKDFIDGYDTVKKYLILKLAELEHEVFGLIHLNSTGHVIAMQEVFRGSLAYTAVMPRELAKECLKHNSASVVIYHNHPGGRKEPSAADLELTDRLKGILKPLDINVVDHIIVAGVTIYSFMENGRI